MFKASPLKHSEKASALKHSGEDSGKHHMNITGASDHYAWQDPKKPEKTDEPKEDPYKDFLNYKGEPIEGHPDYVPPKKETEVDPSKIDIHELKMASFSDYLEREAQKIEANKTDAQKEHENKLDESGVDPNNYTMDPNGYFVNKTNNNIVYPETDTEEYNLLVENSIGAGDDFLINKVKENDEYLATEEDHGNIDKRLDNWVLNNMYNGVLNQKEEEPTPKDLLNYNFQASATDAYANVNAPIQQMYTTEISGDERGTENFNDIWNDAVSEFAREKGISVYDVITDSNQPGYDPKLVEIFKNMAKPFELQGIYEDNVRDAAITKSKDDKGAWWQDSDNLDNTLISESNPLLDAYKGKGGMVDDDKRTKSLFEDKEKLGRFVVKAETDVAINDYKIFNDNLVGAINTVRSFSVEPGSDGEISKIGKRILELNKVNNEIAQIKYTTQEEVDDANSIIDKNNAELAGYKSQYDSAFENYNKAFTAVENQNAKAFKLNQTEQGLEQYKLEYGKDHGVFSKGGRVFITNVASLGLGLENALYKTPFGGTNLYRNIINHNETTRQSRLAFTNDLRENNAEIMSKVGDEKTYNDATNSWYDLADYSVSTVAQAAPLVAALALTRNPYVATGMMYSYGAGEKYYEVDQEIKKWNEERGQEEYIKVKGKMVRNPNYKELGSYNKLNYHGIPFLSGVATAGSEYFTYGQLRGVSAAFRGAKAPIYKGAVNAFKQQLTPKSLLKGTYSVAGEATTEFLDGTAQNGIKKYLQGDENIHSIFQGTDHDFVNGAVVAGLLFRMPTVGANVLRGYQSGASQKKIDANTKRQKEISLLLGSNKLTKEGREVLHKELGDLTVENHNILRQDVGNLNHFSRKEKETLTDLEIEKSKLRNALKELNNSNLKPSEKKAENKKLRKQYHELDAKKEKLISVYNKAQQVKKEEEINNAVIKKHAEKIFGDNIDVQTATSPQHSAELIETSLQERKIAILEQYTRQNTPLTKEAKDEINQINTDLSQIQDINKKPGQQSLAGGALTAYGYITPKDQGGRQKIIVNQKAALEDGFVTTAQHEFLHAVTNETLKNDPKVQKAMGEALSDYIGEITTESLAGTELAERMKSYALDEGVFNEEKMNLLSEAMVREKLPFKKEAFEKVKDFKRRFYQNYLGKDIEFNTGKDVYNFLKDYNHSIKTNKVNNAITKMARQGAGGSLVEGVVPKAEQAKMSKEASDNVQRIYEEQGAAGAFDIIDQFKPITNKLVERRREAPNFDKQLLMDEIETGKRGIYDLIQDYNPDSGVPLAAYVNKYLPSRAIEASQRVLGQEFTEDISGRVDIAAEEVDVEVKAKPKKKKIVLSDRLGVTKEVAKAIEKIVPDLNIEKLTFKNLKNKIPGIIGELFGISPKKLISGANITKKELQSAQMFINKNADLLISMLPEGATASGTATGVPNTLLKAFYTKADRAKMAKTGSKAGLAIQQKNNINKNDFLETFGIIDGKPVRTDRNTSARVLALANLTGKIITNQAVRQELGKSDFESKEIISRLKDGKSNIMFSQKSDKADKVKAIMKNVANKDFKHGNISKTVGSKVLATTIISRPSGKTGILKPATVRDLEGPYNKIENGEQARNRVANSFIKQFPQYFDILRTTMSGGITISMFRTTAEFELAVPNPVSKQNVVKRFAYHKDRKLNPKKIAETKTKEFTKNEKAKLPLFKQFLLDTQTYLKNNPQDVFFFEEMTKDTQNNMNSLVRIVAPYVAFPVNKNGKPVYNKVAIEEHSFPQIVMGRSGISAATAGEVQSLWPVIQASYMQMSLLEADDILVTKHGLKSNVPDVFYEKILPRILNGELKNLPDGYVAFVRYADAGVNLNNYKLLNGQTITEFFGVDGIKNPDGSNNVELQNEILIKQLTGEVAPKYGVSFSKVVLKKDIKQNEILTNAIKFSKKVNEPKGITVLDFDDTLATTKSLVKYTTPDGKTGALNAEQYANTYEDLLGQGYKFDFSEFNKVVKGKIAPLFQKALKLQGKFGPENMFVLTARPPAAQKAIFDFLKANGLNIPIKNITGLANSTAEAKALWMADKVADGYNDFYFADDALQNVQAVKNMLDQFDVKSKVQQAKVKFSKNMNTEFNDILESTTGIESQKVFSDAQAKLKGHRARFKGIIPASAQDFSGLLYNFLSKGKVGEKQMQFFKKALIDPFARGIDELNTSRQTSANDYKMLLDAFPKLKKGLKKTIEGLNYNKDQAARVYLWNKAGFEIPGLSKRDLNALDSFVKNDPELQAFSDALSIISKKTEGYSQPKDYWLAESITSDLLSDGAIGDARSEFLGEWQQNVDQVFSKENLNKIEVIYGSKFKEALQDVLYRMQTGRNKPTGSGRLMNNYMNWVNNSVGTIMFFNMRSALLQTISATNYINWKENNPLKAAAAFANQKQYWKDFSMLFNSNYLKQRRSGNQRGVNEAELSEAVMGSENKAKTVIAWLLKKGFLPTQIADSFAISSGGATFYRNRVNAFVKQGMTQEQAEKQAFLDFQETTEVSQQSARPDMISQQQASPLGRLILSFQNTPMQYARIMNKAARDIANRRGDTKTHISKIAYYGVVQSIIFGALQSALFAAFGEDDEEEFDSKKERILNGMVDSWLSGIGYGGKAISTIKNTIMEYLEQRDKGYRADHAYTLLQLLGFSPPIGSKVRKVYSSIQTEKFNRDVFKKRGFALDNPLWNAIGNVIEGITNIPLGRVTQKLNNLDNALDSSNEWWQRVALLLGWNTWDLGVKDPDIEAVKEEIKEEKKIEKEKKAEIKKEEKRVEKEKEEALVEEANKDLQAQERKDGKKEIKCAAVNKSGNRCGTTVKNGGSYCTIHERVAQNESGKKSQCKKVKKNKKRCGMMTNSKSGYCYYHD